MRKIYIIVLLIIGVTIILYYFPNKEKYSSLNIKKECEIIRLDNLRCVDGRSLLDTVHFLKLEVNPNSFFGYITKLRICFDRIFIFDKRYALALLIFDRSGKHINTINQKGRGPGEFLTLSNFEIDYTNERLILMDNVLSKIMYFDLDGKFIHEVKSSFGANYVACLGRNKIIHAKFEKDYWRNKKKNEKVQLILTEDNGKLLRSIYHYQEPSNLGYQIYDILRGMPDGSVNYAPLLLDTIYTVNENGIIKAKYSLEYKNKVSKNEIYKMSDVEFMQLVRQGKNCFLGHHIETENYLYLRLGIAWHNNPVYYFKKSKKAFMLSRDRGDIEYLFEPLASDGTYFWGMILPEKIEKLKNDQIVIKNDKLNISENDNPWLFYYTLKEI